MQHMRIDNRSPSQILGKMLVFYMTSKILPAVLASGYRHGNMNAFAFSAEMGKYITANMSV